MVDKLNEIAEGARLELERWYDLFFTWTRGLVDADDRSVRHIFEALADDFHVVLTDGRIMGRGEYCERLFSLHAARRGSPRSAITDLRLVPIAGEHVLAVFNLRKEGMAGKKVDTALLRRDPRAPSGISWVHVHESEH